MKSIFYRIGFFSASNPCIAFIFCISLTSILGMGMYNLRLETDPENLWTSPASRTYKEEQDFSDSFGKFYRTNQFMLLNRLDQNENVFQHEGLMVIYFLQQIISKTIVEQGNKNLTLDELCFKPVSGKGCLTPSPMDIWLQDPALLAADKDIQFTTLCTASIDIDRTNIPCSDTNGIPVILKAVLGGTTCQPRENDTQPCEHCYFQAKSMSVTYLLNNNEFTRDDAEIWEKEIYLNTLQRMNKVTGNDENYKWLIERYNNSGYPSPEILQKYMVVFLSERSVSDELKTETSQNVWVVVLSYLIMFIYISIALGQFPSSIFSSFLLGLGGIFIVAVSMLGSVGVVSYLDIGLTMISAEVIPFLILAIGVDNMFIITHTLQRITSASSLPDQMGQTLQQVGPSITTAAICETLAFVVGALTKMPALKNFCIQAAIGVFLDYIFQITVFIAFVTWDQQRKQEKRMDCLFCIERPNHPEGSNPQYVKQFIHSYYNPMLKNSFCRIISGIIFALLMITSVLGCINLENGLEEQVSMVSDSDLFNFFTYEKKYIEIGPPAYMILSGFDFDNQTDLKTVAILSNALAQLNETVQPPIYSWVASFKLFREPDAEWSKICGTEDILLDSFPAQLKRFINTKITSGCCQRFGICGETFQSDIVTDDEGYVKKSRLRFQHRPIHNSAQYILTFEQTRQVIDKIADTEFAANQSAYAYSLPYIFYDQYSYIRGVAIQNVLLALAIILLTVTIIQDIMCALIVTGTVFVITFNLIGLVWLLNVIFGGFLIQINAISVVNLVICIGLGVEFCAHTVIKFRNLSGSRQERSDEAMLTMGNSVFVGIASTKFIGVIVLAFASSTLFKLYYFRMYFLMIITGSFNGLCMLPILLALIGPTSTGKIKRTIVSNQDESSLSENESCKISKRLVNQ